MTRPRRRGDDRAIRPAGRRRIPARCPRPRCPPRGNRAIGAGVRRRGGTWSSSRRFVGYAPTLLFHLTYPLTHPVFSHGEIVGARTWWRSGCKAGRPCGETWPRPVPRARSVDSNAWPPALGDPTRSLVTPLGLRVARRGNSAPPIGADEDVPHHCEGSQVLLDGWRATDQSLPARCRDDRCIQVLSSHAAVVRRVAIVVDRTVGRDHPVPRHRRPWRTCVCGVRSSDGADRTAEVRRAPKATTARWQTRISSNCHEGFAPLMAGLRPRRTVVPGAPEGEGAAVRGHQPVAGSIGGGSDAHHRLLKAHRPCGTGTIGLRGTKNPVAPLTSQQPCGGAVTVTEVLAPDGSRESSPK